MRILKRRTLVEFWTRHPETENVLRAWFRTAKLADWTNSADVKRAYPRASIIGGERVVFDVLGGNYRLIASIKYSARIVYIKFIGTHAEYDRIEATTVDRY